MTQSQGPSDPGDAEERLDLELKEALQTQPLSGEALARIQAAVQREWRTVHATRPRPRVRQMRWAALAAGIGALALGLVWIMRPPTPTVLGSVSRIEPGESIVASQSGLHRSVRAGDLLRSGDELTAHGIGLISLPSGDNLRISPDTTVDVLGASDIQLLRGMIYVDHPPSAAASSQLRVHTRAGTVEHVGTAFEVMSSEQIVRVRVREGRVRLRNAGHDTIATGGTELIANSQGVISQSAFPSNGDSWLWVSAAAPSYDIEGRPLLDFLEFESRELGYELVFSDAHAREVATRTILHGSVRGRGPLDAVTSVLATTSLTFSINGNTLQVRSSDGT